jgi:hypothetical protein
MGENLFGNKTCFGRKRPSNRAAKRPARPLDTAHGDKP